jgi:transcriptional regulator NrdR family protein
LRVQVFSDASASNFSTYTLATDITKASSTSNVYFLQECDDGQFEIYFGDGIVGRALSDNNVVVMEYLVTNKTASNGAKNFSTTAAISSVTDVTTTTVSVASGGAERESIQSIKLNAPLDYAAQGRAVTPEDYKTIIPKVYANTKSVQVWGGEDNSTPVYGRSYISIVPTSGSITASAKEQIVKDLKNEYTIASVTPVIVDPITTSVRLGVTFKYNKKNTTKTAETLVSNVTTTLQNYDTNNLQRFDGVFRHSQLTGLIDDTDESILSNITTVKLGQSFTPILNTNTKYELEFNNAVYNPHTGHMSSDGGVVSSTGFKISGDSNEMFLNDNGNGIIRMFYYTDGTTITYKDETAGTIDYNTGKIILTAFNITSVSNVDGTTSSKIRVVVTPNSTDVVAVRNQILQIDFANTTVTSSEDTIAGGGASAGVGYATTTSYESTSASTSSGY